MKLNLNICNAIAGIILTSVLSYSCQKEEQPDDRGGPLVEKVAGAGVSGYRDGPQDSARFNNPKSVTIDVAGNLYVTDRDNVRIRKISTAGIVSTIAGTGVAGFLNGEASAARFRTTGGITIDSQGNLYVADWDNHKIRKISTDGFVTTFAGGSAGFTNGEKSIALFNIPKGITIDNSGNFYVADQENHSIRKISSSGIVSTVAGNGNSGFIDGGISQARFSRPRDVAVDGAGNLYVADAGNHSIRKITPAGDVTTLAGNGSSGNNDGEGSAARFNSPKGVVVDNFGNIYVADSENHSIRKITPTGRVSTIAGDGTKGNNEREGSTPARFNTPRGLVLDAAQKNLFIVDELNHRIRKLIL